MSAAPSQQYLAFVFSEAGVVSALWQQVGPRIQIIARSTLLPVEGENWVAALDAALEELGSNTLNVKKALFAVPSAWTQDGELIDSKRAFLKDLTSDLLLEPMGFVLIEDTLLAWQEDQLGENFTGTMITNAPTAWMIQRVENGQTTEKAQVGKGGDSTNDWNELQARLTKMSQDHRRGLYLDLSPNVDEYDQVIVRLRQLLQAPVEKIKPDQLAEIAVVQGGREILNDTPADVPTMTTPTVETDETLEPDNEFYAPSFLQGAASASVEEAVIEEDGTGEEDETAVPTRRLPKFTLPTISFGKLRLPKNRKVLLAGGIALLLLLIAGGTYAWSFTQYTANINVELESKTLEKSQTLTLAESASAEAELFIALAPEPIEESVTVEKEVPTTGTKITGEPAKGKVLIYNKTEDLKTFPAGTNLVLNGKTYKLDNDIQIASASSKENTGSRTIEFGTTETTATASFIGPEGNIGKDERFAVANFSSSTYEAVSQEEFSGGSSREIQAVAAKDLSSAESDLMAEAKTQLEEKFAGQNSGDQQIFFAGELERTERKSSNQIDQEAKLVRVQITVTGKAYKLNRETLVSVAEELFADQIPQGYIVQQSSIELNPKRIIEGTPPQVELDIKAKALPDIQPQALQQLVAGEYVGRAKTLLEETPGVQSATISIKPEWASAILPSIPNAAERVKFNLQLK